MVSTRRSGSAVRQDEADATAVGAAGANEKVAAAGTAAQPTGGPQVAAGGVSSPSSAKRQRRESGGSAMASNGKLAAVTDSVAVAAAPEAEAETELPGGLDAFAKLPELRTALRQLQGLMQDDPTVLLRPSPDITTAARAAAKLLYKLASRELLSGGGSRTERRHLRRAAHAPLADLHTDVSFDPEQIWLQLELATEATLQRARRCVKGPAAALAGGAAALVTAEAARGVEELLRGGGGGSSDGDEDGSSSGGDEDEDGDEEDGEGPSGSGGDDDEDEDDLDLDDDEDLDMSDGEDGARPAKKKARKGAEDGGGRRGDRPLEDRFFRFSDMERLMKDAERRAARGGNDDDEEDEDEDGAFASFSGDEDEDDDDAEMKALLRDSAAAAGKNLLLDRGKDKKNKAKQKKRKDAGELRYADFFGGGGGGGGEDGGEEDDEGMRGRGSMFDDDEEGEEEGGGRRRRRGDKGGAAMDEEEEGGSDLGEGDEEEEEDDEEEEAEDAALARRESGKHAGASKKAAAAAAGGGGGKDQAAAAMSSHERRLARLQERIGELEQAALGERSWQLTGDVPGKKRPLNSVLEVDMDFETTAKPAPVQTEEMTNDMEALIKRRITEGKFDDVVRVVAPTLEGKKKEVQLDDTKAKQGLGELYESDFVRQATGGAAEDKEEPLRTACRTLYKALCSKLDALTRFTFAPKPVIEELTVRSEVAAIAMEEAAPVAVSKASMQLPGEVFSTKAAGGAPKAEAELTKEERKQRRAKRKRTDKTKRQAKDRERAARAVAHGGTAQVAGRKSDGGPATVVASKQVRVAEGAGAARHGRSTVANSTAVFAKLADEQRAAAAAGGKKPALAERSMRQAKGNKPAAGGASLKL